MLLDHTMRPGPADVAGWVDASRSRGDRALRTGALFPHSASEFVAAGFRSIDALTLLDIDLVARRRRRGHSLGRVARGAIGRGPSHRMGGGDLDEAAELDRRCFPEPWGNDAAALRTIRSATPANRSRVVRLDGRIVAFAITGRAGRTGYLQRLAVDPEARRHGIGRALVEDACDWMSRHGATRGIVNTAVTNDAAHRLYASCGFQRRPETLHVLELDHGGVR